jgi:hypothetical protein
MKPLPIVALLVVLGIAGSSRSPGAAATPVPQQPHADGPGRVELDNQSVRVFRIHLAPHERIPMHQLGARLVIWLTDAHLRDSLASGRIETVARKAGDVSWVPSQRHSGMNLSDSAVEFIAVEVKRRR